MRPENDAHPTRLAAYVRERRNALGYSQNDLGVSRSTVSRLESEGRTPSRASLFSMAKHLNVQPRTLFALARGVYPRPLKGRTGDEPMTLDALQRRIKTLERLSKLLGPHVSLSEACELLREMQNQAQVNQPTRRS